MEEAVAKKDLDIRGVKVKWIEGGEAMQHFYSIPIQMQVGTYDEQT